MSLAGGLWAGLTRGLSGGLAGSAAAPSLADGSTCPLALVRSVNTPFAVELGASETLWVRVPHPGGGTVSADPVATGETGSYATARVWLGVDCDTLTDMQESYGVETEWGAADGSLWLEITATGAGYAATVEVVVTDEPTFTRSTAGLLYDSRADNWAAATLDAGLSTSTALGQMVVHRTGRQLVAAAGSGEDVQGVRQGQLIRRDDGSFTILYDSFPDGTLVDSSCFAASSADRGFDGFPTKHGSLTGYQSYFGTASGWLAKRGGVYYLFRVIAQTTISGPYKFDIWTSNTFPNAGGWAQSANVPGGTYFPAGGSFTPDFMPGSQIYRAGTGYITFIQGGSPYRCGYQIVATPDAATFAGASTTTLFTQGGWGSATRTAENPKGFVSSVLNQIVILCNLIATSGAKTDANGIAYTRSLNMSDLSGLFRKRIQQLPNDTGTNALGCIAPVTGEDGEAIEDGRGAVAVVYDHATASSTATGYHNYRVIDGGVLEPHPTVLSVAGAGATTTVIGTLAVAHSNCVIESAIATSALHDVGVTTYFAIRFRWTNASNYYVAVFYVTKTVLLKIVAGVTSQVGADGTAVAIYDNACNRVRIRAVGTSIKVYLDETLVLDRTDAAHASGTQVHAGTSGITGQIVGLRCYAADTLTVTGLAASQVVRLRGAAGIPVLEATANGSGVASLTHEHWPWPTLEIDAVDYSPTGGLWGGDSYAYTPGA